MQSLIQMDQELNPVTPATSEPDVAQPAQIEPGPQELCASAGCGEDEIAAAQPDDEEKTETEQTPAHSTGNPAVEEKDKAAQSRIEPPKNAGEMAVNQCSDKNSHTQPTPVTNTSDGQPGEKAKKEEKVRDCRRYIPSKKAMMDPLKMDLSQPFVMPLSSSELSLQCMECHIIFSDHKSKERHLKLSHPAEYEQSILRNALFACYVCDSYFTNSAELMAHQKTHVERKPFRCPICSQAFKRSSELTHHKKIHFGQGGYACTDCGKPCKTLTLLKYHRRTHTGERPYVCKECGKRFSMSKALQKHMLSHLPEGAPTEGAAMEGEHTQDTTAKAQEKRDDVKYPCFVCNATFKTTKTRRRHIVSKHSVSASPSIIPQGKQSNPVITPISICQPSLLQVEPNGPLQKVDANIDTEPIRRLIETLGNVQKVNQVVILGQVPFNAPPLELQQIPQLSQTLSLNLDPPQIDIIGLKQAESKTIELNFSNNSCDPMQQTIILEPITPDGQLENPPFSELGHAAVGEQIELSLVESQQTVGPDVEVMHQILHQPQINSMQSEPMDVIACHNEDLKENQEETVILELTPALIPTDQLEQPHDVPQHEVPSTSLVPTTELENPLDQAVLEEHQTSLSDPPLIPVELGLAPVESIQQDLPTCPFVPPETITNAPTESDSALTESDAAPTESDAAPTESAAAPTESGAAPTESGAAPTESHPAPTESHPAPAESESHFKVDADTQMQTAILDQVHTDIDCGMPQETQEKTAQEEGTPLEEMENTSAKEKAPSPLETKQVPQIAELPVSVMSAQELVKVRKRKSARAFIFQHMHELQLVGHNDDLQGKAKPAKRQKTKKSHLVVKFGPQNKDRKSKKQKKQSQKRQGEVMRGKATNLPEKKTASPKKGRKENKGKKAVHSAQSTPDAATTEITQDLPLPQTKEDARKNKTKKQEDGAKEASQNMSKRKAVFKKKMQSKIIQKGSSQNAKNRKMTNKEQKKTEEKASTDSANVPGPHVTQDCLLLLKGHKQPQLKVYKLDPSKASGQAQDTSPESQPKPQQVKNGKRKAESTDDLTTEEKKKGGRSKKALSMLSPLQVSNQKSETLPVKPKTTRKRKANVETEGVITSSHSKRALECKDCGERFGEVSSLQKHKTTVHIVESPGLTYTNGNIFEGVSNLDLQQLPKQHERIIATDWDTEPETSLEDRQRSVSFPALIPSPSLPIPPADVHECRYEGGDTMATDGRSPNAVGDGRADQIKTAEPSSACSSESHITASNQRTSSDASEPMLSDKQEGAPESAGQATTDEDIKEDVLLEVDLVTIGEQIERNNEDSVSQNECSVTCNGVENTEAYVPTGHVLDEEMKEGPTSQTVSCTAQQMEIKEEEEEVLVQRKKAGKRAASNTERDRTIGAGHLKRDLVSKGVLAEETVSEAEKEHDDCQVVYEEHIIAPDSPTNNGHEGCAQILHSEISESKGAVTTKSAEETTEGEEHNRGSNPSPGVILEKVLTSADAGNNQRLGLEHIAGNQEIKVEENTSEPTPVVPACQHSPSVQSHKQRDRTPVLVKEETNLALNGTQTAQGDSHIQWSVEQVNTDDAGSPLMEIGDTTSSCHVTPTPTPAFNTSHCIFYPVKEEEREVLVGAACFSNGNLSTEASADAQQMQDQTSSDSNLSEGTHTAQEYQNTGVAGSLPEPWANDYADRQDETEAEGYSQSDLRSFLLQSSDEEDAGHAEFAESHIPSEAEVMAQFYQSQISSSPQSASTSQSLPTLRNQLIARRENRTKKPIEYFLSYFNWDTWVEIAHCTNQASKVPDPITSQEVAQFIGIHIAMGTLKFPSLRLYWEDLTRVPLIAEAMSLSRFLQLTAVLKLASLAQDLGNANHGVERNQGTFHDLQSQTHADMQGEIPQQCYRQCQDNAEMDLLWKVQPLLHRFHRGCQSLRRDGDYAVDQYPLLLTGRTQKRKLFLHCTTLIGFGGLLLHVDLKPDLLDKEDAVEKTVPKGSMVFLCKQELSTPAMLERLLAAGSHGAGRVGGARGQIGDEFVSSDGKLMLRRSQCGFILSTAGNVQRNMSSLIENFERAQVSARLNRDLYNLYPIPHTASTLHGWPQAVLWYLTDLALVNSWLVYRQDHGQGSEPLTLMAFRLEVSKALILSSGSDTQDSVPPQPPTEKVQAPNETPNTTLLEESPLPDAATRYDGSGHWPEQLAEGEGGRCRFGNCQRTSRVLCLKCCVFLCISRNHNCFLNFHNQSLGKQ